MTQTRREAYSYDGRSPSGQEAGSAPARAYNETESAKDPAPAPASLLKSAPPVRRPSISQSPERLLHFADVNGVGPAPGGEGHPHSNHNVLSGLHELVVPQHAVYPRNPLVGVLLEGNVEDLRSP